MKYSLLLLSAVLCTTLTSCKTTNADAAGGEYPQYASPDNPYPGQTGYQQASSSPQYPQYQQYTPPQQTYTPAPEPSYTPQPTSYDAPVKKSTTKKKSSSSHGKSYTVNRGDTLYRIALNHGVTVSSLKSANGLHSDVIHPGQDLIIP